MASEFRERDGQLVSVRRRRGPAPGRWARSIELRSDSPLVAIAIVPLVVAVAIVGLLVFLVLAAVAALTSFLRPTRRRIRVQ